MCNCMLNYYYRKVSAFRGLMWLTQIADSRNTRLPEMALWPCHEVVSAEAHSHM